MAGGSSIWADIRSNTSSENEVAIKLLFPATNRFQSLQMLSDLQPRAVVPFSVLGVFRRVYKSKVLEMFQEEHNLNKVSQERKGRLEGSEITASSRRAKEREED